MRVFLYVFFTIIVFLMAFAYFSFQTKDYDFILQSEHAQVSLKDFKGKKLLVYFGFASCPDVCPATLSLLSKELKKLDTKNEAFLLFISLDPQRDNNLSAGNEWLRYFYPHSTFLLAKDEQSLRDLTKRYGVIYEKIDLKDSIMHYSIAHSNELFLFDENLKFVDKINDFSSTKLSQKLSAFLQD